MWFRVDEPFKLLLPTGKIIDFSVGEQQIPDEHANHWYVRAHAVELPADPAGDEAAPVVEAYPVAPDPSITIEDDGSTCVDPQEEVDEKAALKAEAEALGIDVDGRWGAGRLKTEIEAKKNSA